MNVLGELGLWYTAEFNILAAETATGFCNPQVRQTNLSVIRGKAVPEDCYHWGS
jgi:hypothetical protein